MMASGVRPARRSASALRAVADVDDRLRGGDAGIGFRPQHAVADREDARLHGGAELAGRGVVSEDGEGAGAVRIRPFDVAQGRLVP